jgi:hypothetical protein
MPRATINWRVYELVERGVLIRVGRGKFRLAKEEDLHKFVPKLPKQAVEISAMISREFPFSQYCVWSVDVIKEFSQHIPQSDFLLIDCEREACEAVFNRVQSRHRWTYLDPDKELMTLYVNNVPGAFVVRPLITEAPIQRVDSIPTVTIEKLLVDITCDDAFELFGGSELLHIYDHAFTTYQIQGDRLLRYASRKGMKSGPLLHYYRTHSHENFR